MTGFGEARSQSDGLTVAVELRALNNRYLKLSIRANEPYNLLEPEIEKVLRRTLKRGTVQVQLRVQRQQHAEDFRLNPVAVRAYIEQLRSLDRELSLGGAGGAASVLALPGVVIEPDLNQNDPGQDWIAVEPVLEQALAKLQTMRQDEGRAMAQELRQLNELIAAELAKVRERAPRVVANYRDKLHERLKNFLAEMSVTIDQKEIIKEVAVFAERSDITEEIVRLSSHVDQFHEIMKEPESPGRKLEFLTQEMFRETNTIGSKANDVEIARQVVEIKGSIEKIRELIQNIE
jgi:uncharacterized protein (TIGR00255 family)